MSVPNIIEYTIAIVLASGITSTFVVGLFGLIGKTLSNGIVEKFKSDLQTTLEVHKTKLKKSEFLFQKEYEAASEFISLKRSFLPSYRVPDMDWHDVCVEIAQNFGRIEGELSSFISLHGAVLDQEAKELLFKAQSISAENMFSDVDSEPSSKETDAANLLWETVECVETHLLSRVNSQATV